MSVRLGFSAGRTAIAMIVAMGILCGAGAAVAQQTAPVILYSYTKVVVGSDIQYVLMPTPTRSLKIPVGAKPSPAIFNGAWKELRDRKKTTYGSTSFEIDTRSLAKGVATVKLDKARAKYHPIIISEVVYTMTQLGLKGVNFPGTSRGALTRKDVEFGAYRLTIPAWRVLPPKTIPAAIIIMPNGTEITSEDFDKKVKAKDADIVALMKKYLGDKDPKLVLLAIEAIGAVKPAESTDMLLPLLKNKDRQVRTTTLKALSGIEDTKVLDAISTVMDKDKDKAVALMASQILSKSKNKLYSVRALYFALRGTDDKASIDAIGKLAASKEPSVAPELIKAARGKRAKVAEAAIVALNTLKQEAALVALFGDKKIDMPRRIQSAALIAAGGSKEGKFKALSFQVVNDKGSVAIAGLNALVKTKDPATRTAVEAALVHPEAKVRHAAAGHLANIKDPESLKALSKAGTRPEDVEVIEDAASRIMAKMSLQDVLQYTSNRNPVLKRVAYLALGVKVEGGTTSKQVFDALQKGVKSKDTGVRGASVRGLGPYKNDKALQLVVGLAKDTEGAVRRDVARSLGYWPAGTNSDILLGYLADSNHETVQASVEALHKRFEEKAYKPILKLTRGKAHPSPGVRAAVLKAIVALAPQKELQTVISVLSGGLFDKDKSVKFLAIDLLGNYDNTAAVTGLAALINDPVEEYRIRALGALGATRSTDAIELVASVISDQSIPVRVAAMKAMGTIGKKACAEPIRTRLAVETEIEVLKAGEAALKKLK